jgi:hypothetical protein
VSLVPLTRVAAALAGLRRALVGASSIEAASVSGHDLDLRMIPEPGSRGSSRSALKDIDDLTPFEVDNNCPVVVSPPGSPIVDAHHANGMACSIRGRPPLQMAQDRVGATGDAHPPKQPLARQAAGRMAGRVDQGLDLVTDPRESPRNVIKSFGEGYAPTASVQTSEPSDSRIEGHPSGLDRQILNPTMVGAVDARRRSPAPWTSGRTNPHSLQRPLAPTMRRTPNANIPAENPVAWSRSVHQNCGRPN